MCDDKHDDLKTEEEEILAETNSLPGVIVELGELQPASIITEEGIARLFHRHVVSVKRAVQRAELPPPCRLFGVNVWTVGTLIRYIESRLEKATKERDEELQRFRKHTPLPHRRRL